MLAKVKRRAVEKMREVNIEWYFLPILFSHGLISLGAGVGTVFSGVLTILILALPDQS